MTKKTYLPADSPRDVVWVGNSLKALKTFGKELTEAFGYGLEEIQFGRTPQSAKSAEVPGTMKLVENSGDGTYRVVYTTKLKTAVFVLHAFQKKSKSGIKTPDSDIKLIRDRLKRAAEFDKERENAQKEK